MENSENVQNENYTPVSQPPNLTRDHQEHFAEAKKTRDEEYKIIVSTLRKVISSDGGDTSLSNWIASDNLPPLDAGPCPLCGVTGCYGCAFPRQEEIKEEKKHKGVRRKPSGNWSAEIWDPRKKARTWLGTFPTSEMAAHAYNEAAAELVGRRSARRSRKNGEGSSHSKEDGRGS